MCYESNKYASGCMGVSNFPLRCIKLRYHQHVSTCLRNDDNVAVVIHKKSSFIGREGKEKRGLVWKQGLKGGKGKWRREGG